MSNLIIRTLGNPTRCEICHLSDLFDPETNSCQRCQHLSITLLSDSTAHEPVEEVVQYRFNLYFCGFVYFLVTQLSAYFIWHHVAFWAEAIESTWLAVCVLTSLWLLWVVGLLHSLVQPSDPDNCIVIASHPAQIIRLPLGIEADIKKLKVFSLALSLGVAGFLLLPFFLSGSTLQRCFEDRCTQTLKLYLAMGLNPNTKIQEVQGEMPHNLLYWAILDGNEAQVRLLLEYGANPNTELQKSALFSTPLSVAASKGKAQIVKALLDHSAQADASDSEALIAGILSGNPQVIKYLLQAGANPNAQFGRPIVEAVLADNFQILKLLIEAGANPVINTVVTGLAEVKQNQGIIYLLNTALPKSKKIPQSAQYIPPDELKPQSAELLISIGFPIQTNAYQLPDQYPVVQVIFTNVSNVPIQLLTGDKFPTGSDLLQMELRDKDGTITPLTRSSTFYKPVQSVLKLLPGESKVFSERLDEYRWTGFPKRTDEKSRFYEIKVMYENLESQLPGSPALWTGRVESKWIKFELIK